MTRPLPKNLRQIATHIEVRRSKSGGNWIADCPFCDKENHFFINADTGMWDCKVCGASGNPVSFMTQICDAAQGWATKEDWLDLRKSRNIPVPVLRDCGLGYNPHTGEWLIPCRSHTGAVHDIRRYDGKQIKSTAGCKLQLWNEAELVESREKTVYLCEGEWDGMAMRWLLEEADRNGIVVATPGATIFKDSWLDYFKNKHVVGIYDADEAGDNGQVKMFTKLTGIPGCTFEFVNWAEDVPNGYDLRDFVTSGMKKSKPRKIFNVLKSLVGPKPRRRVGIRGDDTEEHESKFDDLRDMDFKEVVDHFKSMMYMTEDLVEALRTCLAVVISEDVKDDPVWMYLVAPPSSGKTALLGAFQDHPKCVFKSAITAKGLISGFRREGGKDPSLLPKIIDKSLIIKDFTEILSKPLPERLEMYSVLRGVYDGHASRTYGNGEEREYPNCHCTIMAGTTFAILGHSEASMGERFLKFVMKEVEDEDVLDRILTKALNAQKNSKKSEMKMQYAVSCFLRQEVDPNYLPEWSEDMASRLRAITKLISHMRSEVARDERTGDVKHDSKKEMPTRLMKQLGKLGRVLAWMDGKTKIDEETWQRVRRVAIDSIYGFHFDIVSSMVELGGKATKSEISSMTGIPSSTIHRRFQDLEYMRVMRKTEETRQLHGPVGGRPAIVFELTKRIQELWSTSTIGESKCRGSRPDLKNVSRSSTSGSGRRRRGSSKRRKVRQKPRTRSS